MGEDWFRGMIMQGLHAVAMLKRSTASPACVFWTNDSPTGRVPDQEITLDIPLYQNAKVDELIAFINENRMATEEAERGAMQHATAADWGRVESRILHAVGWYPCIQRRAAEQPSKSEESKKMKPSKLARALARLSDSGSIGEWFSLPREESDRLVLEAALILEKVYRDGPDMPVTIVKKLVNQLRALPIEYRRVTLPANVLPEKLTGSKTKLVVRKSEPDKIGVLIKVTSGMAAVVWSGTSDYLENVPVEELTEWYRPYRVAEELERIKPSAPGQKSIQNTEALALIRRAVRLLELVQRDSKIHPKNIWHLFYEELRDIPSAYREVSLHAEDCNMSPSVRNLVSALRKLEVVKDDANNEYVSAKVEVAAHALVEAVRNGGKAPLVVRGLTGLVNDHG